MLKHVSGILAALALAALSGCASKPAPVTAPPVAQQSSSDGLELRLWPIEESSPALARLFLPYEKAESPLDPRTLKRLRDSGLRVVVVPSDDLDRIAANLKFRGAIEAQASRDRSEWSIFVASKGSQSFTTIRSADGNLVLGSGELRLLGRAWVAPGPSIEGKFPAVLRVELMGRHVEEKNTAAKLEDALRPQVKRPVETEGIPLPALDASFQLNRGQSLVIIPEYPDVDWTRESRLPNYIEKEPETTAEINEALNPNGPIAPDVPTLGHGLLSDATFGAKPRKRAILVLVPKLPAEFRLFR
ncbi:MAG: hypothetical protein U0570_12125 [Phycisphaerales bacterium]